MSKQFVMKQPISCNHTPYDDDIHSQLHAADFQIRFRCQKMKQNPRVFFHMIRVVYFSFAVVFGSRLNWLVIASIFLLLLGKEREVKPKSKLKKRRRNWWNCREISLQLRTETFNSTSWVGGRHLIQGVVWMFAFVAFPCTPSSEDRFSFVPRNQRHDVDLKKS